MKIEEYQFGRIKINGKIYTKDLIVYPSRISENWWRKEGHVMCTQDIGEILDYKPEILIIGTGYSGIMKVPENVVKEVEKRGIKTEIYSTKEAVKKFNEYMEKGRRVVCALHLTC